MEYTYLDYFDNRLLRTSSPSTLQKRAQPQRQSKSSKKEGMVDSSVIDEDSSSSADVNEKQRAVNKEYVD